jgi:outer membrane protein assembly factor BamA
LPFGFFAARLTWVIALVFLLAIASTAAPPENLHADAPSSAHSYLFSASFDYASGKEVTEDHSSADPQAAGQLQPAAHQQFVIDRIEFLGNRRVRSDTLKARIFSREGDVYNEDTLRRDFQALWNTQFFEDVKLRVEDSPNRASGKIII